MELVGILGCVGDVPIIKRVEGFTMRYEEAEKIFYKNVTRVPRTWSEATKDAEYACWLDVERSEWKDALEFSWGFLFMLPLIALAGYVLWVAVKGVG